MSDDLESRARPEATGPSPAVLFARGVLAILKPLASLRLTVILFALGIVLVFYGTIAQMDQGIHGVMKEYFRSWFVWIPLQLSVKFLQVFFSVPPDFVIRGSVPFPAGYAIGVPMLVNLIAAHVTRFRWGWRRSGIFLIHAGLIVLMLGELITGMRAIESRLVVVEKEHVNYLEEHERLELAFVRTIDAKTQDTIVIPDHLLRDGATIDDPQLPFVVEVVQMMKNADIIDVEKNGPANPATAGDGLRFLVKEIPEVSGTDTEKANLPAGYVRIKDRATGANRGTFLVVNWWMLRNFMNFPAQPVTTSDGVTYTLALRNKRIYKPYSIHLYKTEHKKYAGTDKARDYASIIRLEDHETGEVRDQVRIWMNHPLRYRGETFYQSGLTPLGNGKSMTILQVVRNPAWALPYISCVMMSAGMLIHFGLALGRFLSVKRSGSRPTTPPGGLT